MKALVLAFVLFFAVPAWSQEVSTRTVFSTQWVEVQLDYDNSNRITGVRVINNGATNVYVEAEQISNGRKYGSVFLAGTTTVIPVPTGVGQRLTQFQDSRGFWDGLNVRLLDPAP